MTEQDIINLNNYWYLNDHEWLGKKHKTNNPWHYVKRPNYATNEHRKQRLNDLNVVLTGIKVLTSLSMNKIYFYGTNCIASKIHPQGHKNSLCSESSPSTFLNSPLYFQIHHSKTPI